MGRSSPRWRLERDSWGYLRVCPWFPLWFPLASEPHPPTGEAPVEWLLLTNLPADTPEQALEKLQWYLGRWHYDGVSRACPCDGDLAGALRLLSLRDRRAAGATGRSRAESRPSDETAAGWCHRA